VRFQISYLREFFFFARFAAWLLRVALKPAAQLSQTTFEVPMVRYRATASKILLTTSAALFTATAEFF
jgi:hypothetical protein